MSCECGCGEAVNSGSFRPGHDQRLRTALEHRVGGLRALREIVVAVESFSAKRTSLNDFAKRIQAVMEAANG